MNHGPLIFLGVFAAFVASWWGMIFTPQIQIGAQAPVTPEGTTVAYPTRRPGLAEQGHQVYVANGCAYCHSQQVRQDGYTFDVLFGGTTNQAATTAALAKLGVNTADTAKLVASATDKAPQPVLKNVSQKISAAAQTALQEAGATASVLFVPTGADITRGWGLRQSVARDYLYEAPVQIGNSRLGPDLANVGLRRADAAWQLRHLYNPRIDEKGSLMPAYPFLFEKRKAGKVPSPDALKLPEGFAPAGFEIVPRPEALQLVAYLQSLRVQTALFEAPMAQLPQTPAAADTNALPAGAPSK
jgi:cbb3-type cytochrome oxidase cytochrome c subunit